MTDSVKLKRCLDMIEFLTKSIDSDLWSLHYYPTTHVVRLGYLERISVTCKMLISYRNELNELLENYVQKDTL